MKARDGTHLHTPMRQSSLKVSDGLQLVHSSFGIPLALLFLACTVEGPRLCGDNHGSANPSKNQNSKKDQTILDSHSSSDQILEK